MLLRRCHCWVAAACLAAAAAAQGLPIGVAISSDSNEAAISGNQIGDAIYQLDLATGLPTSSARLPAQSFEDVEGLAFGRDGVLYGIDDDSQRLLTIDPLLGTVLSAASTRLPVVPGTDPSLTFACDGRLLSATATGRLYQLDPATGVATQIGSGQSLPRDITDLAARGDQVYGLGLDRLYRINVANGTATAIGSYGGNVQFSQGGGMAFDASGQLWAIADRVISGSQIYRINASSGAATLAGSSAIVGIESLAIAPTVCPVAPSGIAGVPIPAHGDRALLLLGLLLAGAGLLALPRRG